MVSHWIITAELAVIAAAQAYTAYLPWKASRKMRQVVHAQIPTARVRAGIAEKAARVEAAGAQAESIPVARASMASLRARSEATLTEEQARERRVSEFGGN